MSHTPTPWRNPTSSLEIIAEPIRDDWTGAIKQKVVVARVSNNSAVSGDVTAANAAFIVKAVNTHDELTEAVELLLTCVYAGYAPGNPTSDEAIAKGQAALAKAGAL